eukprot:GEZU01000021.1.p1 GENE.GEZU01000021.1~~GEZU01000021.1.p1  ORF type:complete len:211 (+),score=16.05 GEZU01000021.1:234-866(+)
MSDNGDEMGEENPYNSQVREQDRFLPIANISRIMKKSLPQNAKIAKEGKETVQECVSEFISFITSEASDRCQQEKRKTINGEDLLWAMGTLGFDNYIEPLRLYLNKYREVCSQTQTRVSIFQHIPHHTAKKHSPRFLVGTPLLECFGLFSLSLSLLACVVVVLALCMYVCMRMGTNSQIILSDRAACKGRQGLSIEAQEECTGRRQLQQQ